MEGSWSARVDADTGIYWWLGPGNTNVTGTGWWVGGTRYAPSQYPPSHTTPGTPLPTAPHRALAVIVMYSTANSSFGSAKEILGVDNAL